jgi:anti-anti-sigma regulatory factor
MHEHALMIKTVRDGPVCALILRGALDPGQTDGFLGQAVAAAGNRAGRLVLDPARVTFPGCAAVPAVATAASFAPRGGPAIIRSLSPRERRTLELPDLDARHIRPAGPGPRTMTRTWAGPPVPRSCPAGSQAVSASHER